MLVAYSPDRRDRYTPDHLSAFEARDLARAGLLVCPDPACDAHLVFVPGSPHRQPFWRHAAGSRPCSVSERDGAEGEFHIAIKNSWFAGAQFEVVLPTGARADVIVTRPDGSRWAVEIQHSPIAKETVAERMHRHEVAGLVGTLWVLDAQAAGVSEANLTWLETDDRRFYPAGAGPHRGAARDRNAPPIRTAGVPVQALWAADLIAYAQTSSYPLPVVLATPDLRGRRIMAGYINPTGFTATALGTALISGDVARAWAGGGAAGFHAALTAPTRESPYPARYDFEITDTGIRHSAMLAPLPGAAHHGFVGGFGRDTCPCVPCARARSMGEQPLHAVYMIAPVTPDALAYAHAHSIEVSLAA